MPLSDPGAWLAWAGLALWVRRLGVRRLALPAAWEGAGASPFVSIIVPARNEAAHLPALLASLAALEHASREVIVVDDCSEDGTAAVARAGGVRVVDGRPRPDGWGGKQWACHQGAAAARGELLLFTDADTRHAPQSLTLLVRLMRARRLEMASAVPFHAGGAWWERLSGPFHLLLLAVTAPFAAPTPTRKYAIGQYLAFTRAAYDALGGHAAVRACWVEDMPLARLALARGVRYGLLVTPGLYVVRMYDTLGAFLHGWRRNIRAGFDDSPRTAPLEMALLIGAPFGGGALLSEPAAAVAAALTIVYLVWRQRPFGRFSAWGPVLFGFAAALFCWVSLLAALDRALGREQRWKGRRFRPEAGAAHGEPTDSLADLPSR